MPKFERAPREINDFAERIIARDYPDLHELMVLDSPTQRAFTIDLVFVHGDEDENGEPLGPAIRHQGYPCDGLCRIINLRDRAMGRGDVEIQLDHGRWKGMGESSRRRCLPTRSITFNRSMIVSMPSPVMTLGTCS